MKKLFFLLFTVTACQIITAQNVGIGTTEPLNKLQVNGNLLVSAPTTATNTAPTVAQTKTMLNASNILFSISDSTGRFYDPGGPAGNYLPNMTANTLIDGASGLAAGIEITAETMQLGTGDSLIIKETSSSPNNLLAVGNGYSNTGKWVFNYPYLYITFKSNADANTGSGFSLLFKKLYSDAGSASSIQGITTNAMFFETATGAFRSGNINNSNRGLFSFGAGTNNIASGIYSRSLGASTTASGDYSTALGSNTTASGDYSSALGRSNTASGDNSTALGFSTNASGLSSHAIGATSTASGDYSIVLGRLNVASGAYSTATGKYTDATGYASTAMGDSCLASGDMSWAAGLQTTASGLYSTAFGYNTTAAGQGTTAMGGFSTASGFFSTAMGLNTTASSRYSTTMGEGTLSNGYAGTVVGMYNQPISGTPDFFPLATTPLFIVGNGNASSALSNAMVVLKNGNVGIGTNAPDANLHIRHASGGGLILENSSDNNRWRIYSASGDNNLTFYNNANAEVADIDDVTGAYTAISDSRLKKNIEGMKPVLPLIMKLNPSYYQFNWQQTGDQRQIGFLAQETYKLFPELVSYSADKDLYKMNYAGFSTVAIKAIQEQQVIIHRQQQKIDTLEQRLQKLEALLLHN